MVEVFSSAGRAMIATFMASGAFVLISGAGFVGLHQAIVISTMCGSIAMVRYIVTYEIELKRKRKTKAIDMSPQARFMRDEIDQLQMEQEIDSQLAIGLSGVEPMNRSVTPEKHWAEKSWKRPNDTGYSSAILPKDNPKAFLRKMRELHPNGDWDSIEKLQTVQPDPQESYRCKCAACNAIYVLHKRDLPIPPDLGYCKDCSYDGTRWIDQKPRIEDSYYR
jgi:hypothetical protein